MDALPQRIEPAATWDDLLLAEPEQQILREIASHVRQRAIASDPSEFSPKGSRESGVSALFTGPDHAGKAIAAEALAIELGFDLYRIDLASIVSQYIGETEANLRRIFDLAEEDGVLLLFDEADALFGQRGEVKDSRDRDTHIEAGYLWQRLETCRCLAIFTANTDDADALDKSFLRHMRFVVDFGFSDADQRDEP